jgi:hypothetical protein
LVIVPLVRNALHRGLGPRISGPIALLGCLVPLALNTVARVLSYVASLIDEIAFVTLLVTFVTLLVTLIRG